ncbi:hypothetical protein GGH94_005776 [Coemansia aciculifera]|uniref:Uncharacterized protein n=2 Tax=Coemansia TaxID=4863 RepID=A0A9W8L8E6_9FUNG|nr:hypothetical protein GGI19_006239 [Coemansia pectinata]KAJ2859995.1 hypothetical protein GGH94_005776 [Coemansia aciculifera]KAJ2870241.1 hypothetical protein GGH93_005716 [Coemansia aciculifera]KAJ2880873.1 hypothetical protein H4R27_004458 [Coemansia aciculifera]
MAWWWRWTRLLLLLSIVLSGALAKDVTKFCKCTCGQNSTIIELTKFALEHLPHASKPIDVGTLMPNVCMNCTRLLCGIAEPQLCEGAAVDEEIVPLCFQRDSLQDELIVVGFLLLVGGLLAWATIRDRVGPLADRLWNQYNNYVAPNQGE